MAIGSAIEKGTCFMFMMKMESNCVLKIWEQWWIDGIHWTSFSVRKGRMIYVFDEK